LARNTEPAKSSSFDSVLIISVVYSHNWFHGVCLRFQFEWW
jgi:hypothetical protein